MTKRKVVSGLTPQQSVVAGIAFTVLGSYLLWEGFDGSGRRRPFWARFLPGP